MKTKSYHIFNLKLLFSSLLITALFSCSSTSQNLSDPAICGDLKELVESHDSIRLQDIYKSCMQGVLGVAHLIDDSSSAHEYLLRELEQMQSDSANIDFATYYERCGVGEWSNYYRVYLSAIQDKKITSDELLSALLRSAKLSENSDVADWKDKWKNIIVKRLSEGDFNIPNFASDSARIDSLLNLNKYVLSHSDVYRQNYYPHYRVIDKTIFFNEFLYRFEKEITPVRLNTILSLESKCYTVVDVRTAQEYEQSHFVQADLNIDYLAEDFVEKASNILDQDKLIVVYCKSGKRGLNATNVLRDCGFKVVNVIGGIENMRRFFPEEKFSRD